MRLALGAGLRTLGRAVGELEAKMLHSPDEVYLVFNVYMCFR